MAVGVMVKRLRKQKGLTQTELSEKSGLLQTTISAIERGTEPTTDTLRKLALALEVSSDSLLGIKKSTK